MKLLVQLVLMVIIFVGGNVIAKELGGENAATGFTVGTLVGSLWVGACIWFDGHQRVKRATVQNEKLEEELRVREEELRARNEELRIEIAELERDAVPKLH